MFNQVPYQMYGLSPSVGNVSGAAAKTSILGKINWSSLLSNAQKTLNVVNQAIPLYYQVKPVFNNIKTLGKIGRELTKANVSQQPKSDIIEAKNNDVQVKNINVTNETQEEIPTPTFFL